MNKSLIISVLLIIFVLAAGFGLFMPAMSHAEHSMGCAVVIGGTSLCATPLQHIEHWEETFAAIVTMAILLVKLAAVVFVGRMSLEHLAHRYSRYRLAFHTPPCPPLLQELYADGILNCKDP